jgi:tetratricopeptide (TPR) repeat protein
MSEPSRLADLRRRVQSNPASIAFAQLAEEHRRAGQWTEAIQVCQAGLAIHPGYLSARVTLGRALLAVGRLDDAQLELHSVLVTAPDHLAAVRSLAEIFERRGETAAALGYYQQALRLAGHDRDLEQTVSNLTRGLAAPTPLTSDESQPLAASAFETRPDIPAASGVGSIALPEASRLPLPSREPPQLTEVIAMDDLERQHALQTIAALEQWLTALNGSGAERHP